MLHSARFSAAAVVEADDEVVVVDDISLGYSPSIFVLLVRLLLTPATTASDIGRGDGQQRRRRTGRICWSIMVSSRGGGVGDVAAPTTTTEQKNAAVSGIMQARIAQRTAAMTPWFVGMRRGKKPLRRNGVGRRASMNCSR